MHRLLLSLPPHGPGVREVVFLKTPCVNSVWSCMDSVARAESNFAELQESFGHTEVADPRFFAPALPSPFDPSHIPCMSYPMFVPPTPVRYLDRAPPPSLLCPLTAISYHASVRHVPNHMFAAFPCRVLIVVGSCPLKGSPRPIFLPEIASLQCSGVHWVHLQHSAMHAWFSHTPSRWCAMSQ
jgi:hypothetical protein